MKLRHDRFGDWPFVWAVLALATLLLCAGIGAVP